jgi:SAM-dependent methyltransferase
MIVPNPEKMIKEAARVLKPHGKACFTVWGRPERCLFFSLESTARKNLGLPVPKVRMNFDFAMNIDHMKEVMREAGFTEIKHWF